MVILTNLLPVSDQLCSLIFSLSNIYVLGCLYAGGFGYGFHSSLQECGTNSRRWPIPFALASLPLLARLVQSVRRYFDSKLVMHLINVSIAALNWLLLTFPFNVGRKIWGGNLILSVLLPLETPW